MSMFDPFNVTGGLLGTGGKRGIGGTQGNVQAKISLPDSSHGEVFCFYLDIPGIRHHVEVEAQSRYEAAALGVKALNIDTAIC